MPNADSPLDWFVKLPFLSWMTQGGQREGADGDEQPEESKPKQQTQQQQQRCSPPKLCPREPEVVVHTAPASTCESSVGASWSGCSDTSGGGAGSHDMASFHRLNEQEGEAYPGKGRPQLTLTIDEPEPAPARTPAQATPATPVDIPWRLIDPDSATTPMQEVGRASFSLALRPTWLVFIGGISACVCGTYMCVCLANYFFSRSLQCSFRAGQRRAIHPFAFPTLTLLCKDVGCHKLPKRCPTAVVCMPTVVGFFGF